MAILTVYIPIKNYIKKNRMVDVNVTKRQPK